MKKTIVALGLSLSAVYAFGQQRVNPALDSLRNEKDAGVLASKLQKLGSGSEEQMMLLQQYYGRNRSKVDSLSKVMLVKFPKGRMATNAAQSKIFGEPTGEKQEAMLGEFKKEFPAADLDQLNYSVAYAYLNSKNKAKVLAFAKEIKSADFRYAIIQGLSTLDVKASESVMAGEVAGLSKGEKNADYDKAVSLYSKILTKAGKNKEALGYTKEAYGKAAGKDDELTRNYGYLLAVNGNHAEALPVLEKLAVAGKADEQVKAQLKMSYAKLNPGKDAQAYLTGLQSTLKENIQQQVAKLMVNEASPNFVVSDASGKKVSLADFKGKTIVLDFWATWCAPCKRSFPAMQMAVNKYKNDPNVKFLFIHTWERIADPLTDAKQYLKANNYTFDLYMDDKDPSTKMNPAVALFGVRGIPAKFVIDGQGRIRYKLTGFGGGNDAAVEELSTMIETSRNPGS